MHIVIAIDGPAGAGKSSVAKALAKALHCSYLDTGAMYRTLTLKALRQKIALDNEDALIALAKKTSIDLRPSESGSLVFLDGENVSQEIRTLEVTNNTFYIARAPRVREIMVDLQREIGGRSSVVAEGRDIGTVVFPQATKKFYLDANIEERTRRRVDELRASGKHVDADRLLTELKERDQKDLTRSTGPLKKADDAIFIDSTHMSIEDVVQIMLKHINQ